MIGIMKMFKAKKQENRVWENSVLKLVTDLPKEIDSRLASDMALLQFITLLNERQCRLERMFANSALFAGNESERQEILDSVSRFERLCERLEYLIEKGMTVASMCGPRPSGPDQPEAV